MTSPTETRPAPNAPTPTALGPILTVDAPALSPVERTLLLLALNLVRQGAHVVYATVRYDKQTGAEARIEGEDYISDGEGEDGKTHRVVIVAAPLNRQGSLYVKSRDFSRANGEKPWQWTNFIPRGFRSEPGKPGFVITGYEVKEAPAP